MSVKTDTGSDNRDLTAKELAAIEEEYEEGARTRAVSTGFARFLKTVALAFATYHYLTAGFALPADYWHMGWHLSGLFILIYALFPMFKTYSAYEMKTSMSDGLRVAGTAEFAGLDAPVNDKRLAGLIRLARRISPDLRAEAHTTWSGQRPSLPDSPPCIVVLEGVPGPIAAFGHSHYGLMMAPKTGELVADTATGRAANIDLSSYRATRS